MDEEDIDKLIEFMTKDAFEGLDYTDPYSVERAIRTWFKVKNEESFINAMCPNITKEEIENDLEKFQISPLRNITII